MADFVMKLQELKQKILNEFDAFKHYNIHSESDPIDPKNLDTLLFKVRYQIDQMKTDILSGRNEEDCNRKDIESQKTDALIKLQTLATLITCRIINLDNGLL